MDQAIAMGMSRRKVYRRVEQKIWKKLHSGIFLTTPDVIGDAAWKATLAGQLLSGGEKAMVSHRSAGLLHSLEGIHGLPVETAIPLKARTRPEGSHRTRCVDPNPITVDGLITTSLARTLIDLADVCEINVLEQAIESALRGPDPRRPDLWNKELLCTLRKLALVNMHRSGNFRLQTVLNRRLDTDRPTGSFPETLLFQELRLADVPAISQPTLRIVDRHGTTLDTLYPDVGIESPLLLVEVDGLEVHTGQKAFARDLQRQNKISLGFTVRRYSAAQVLADAPGVANEIKQLSIRLDQRRTANSAHPVGNLTVNYSTNEFVMIDSSRDARREAASRRKLPMR